MTVRMRHTKGHTRNRRSHHKLKKPALTVCPECKASHIRHQVCMECGKYRGRQVVDVVAMNERKHARKEAKEKAIGEVTGQAPEPTKGEDDAKQDPKAESGDSARAGSKPLSAEELSKK